jgi:hypothetical protein
MEIREESILKRVHFTCLYKAEVVTIFGTIGFLKSEHARLESV